MAGFPLARSQRRYATATCLSVSRLVSPPIREPLADDALEGFFSPRFIVNAEFGARVLPEIEFCKVPMKVLLSAVLVCADHAAFEHREETLKRVCMDLRTTVALANVGLVVIDNFVTGSRAEEFVNLRAVRVERAVRVDVGEDRGRDIVTAGRTDLERADTSATLD